MKNNVYQVKLNQFHKLNKIDRQGILVLANELTGLFDLKKRNFDKYAAKYPDGDELLKEYKIGKELRVQLETACCLVLNKDMLNQKERGRLRQIIDGTVAHNTSKVVGLQWNKSAMTVAHTSHRGASGKKTTANYKKK